jgi:ABC-type transport system involved in resistance to organic solvents, periplasmic component
MSREYSWSELRIGMLSAAGILLVAFSVLIFARVGALHGKKSKIVILTDHAPGVLSGTEVWLAGVRIGLVNRIEFRPVSADTSRRVAIDAVILTSYMPQIRRNAHADIRPGGNLIGSPVVYISSGTSDNPPARDGDTIVTKSVGVIKDVGTNVTELVSRLTVLSDSGSKALALLNSEAGAAGAFTRRGLPRIASVTGAMSGIMAKAMKGDGSAGLLARGDVGPRFRRVMSAKDSLTYMLTSSNGNFGRFHRDSTLGPTVARLKNEVDSLQGMMSGSGSSLAKMRTDTAFASQLRIVRAQLDSLMTDIKKHPRKYL